MARLHYCDTGVEATKEKWPKYIEALKTGKMAALTGQVTREGRMRRHGYIALYRIDNLSVTDHGLEFDFVEKLAALD